jgi:hypothetical protein
MITTLCPICQEKIVTRGQAFDTRNGKQIETVCPIHKSISHDVEGFWGMLDANSSEIISYCTNIKINNVMYGLDSQSKSALIGAATTQILILRHPKNIELLSTLTFTPVPKSKDDLEYIVKRILNLKAFL